MKRKDLLTKIKLPLEYHFQQHLAIFYLTSVIVGLLFLLCRGV